MATLTFYKPYDMSAPTLWIGPIVSYSSTHVTLSDGHYTGTVYGNFTFTSTGVSGGTVTGYEQSLDGVLELKLTDGNYSALAMLDFLLKGNLIGLLKFMIAGDDTVIGSNGNDILLGLIGDDILLGNLGDDTLNGGADSDWASYSSASGGVTVNLALAGAQNTVNAGSDTLLNMENLIGSDYGDTLIGNTFANTLKGGTGNDKLNGGSGGGADLLDGGEGSDWAYYDTAPSKVVVNLGIPGLQSTLGGGADQLLNIENLMGSHFNDTLIGNAADNKLNGGDGDDQLDGGLGDDILDGGAGSDWANYDNAAASVVINLAFTGIQNTLSAGSDKLLSIENVLGSGFDDLLLGNAADNNLKGGLGDDRLSGGLGNDDLNGGVGSDWVSYGPASGGVTVNLALSGPQNTVKAGSDTLISIENLIGSNYADTLIGNASANTLKGGTGNDKLNGGSGGGADLLGDPLDAGERAAVLVERLRTRLGLEAVHGLRLGREHRPERAWGPVANPVANPVVNPVAARAEADAPPAGAPRPLWFLEAPLALGAEPAFQGPLALDGGPERIETGWWDGGDVRRDYYAATNPRGLRLWVFQDRRAGGWYLHGLFG